MTVFASNRVKIVHAIVTLIKDHQLDYRPVIVPQTLYDAGVKEGVLPHPDFVRMPDVPPR